MRTMIITRAEEGDLDRILTIQREAYLSEAALYDDFAIPPLVQTLDDLRAEFRRKVILKAMVEQQILGSVRVALSQDVCLLGRLIVTPAAQGRGIGSALLSAGEVVFSGARSVELFTGSRSAANIHFYEKRGYVRSHEEVLSPKVTLVYLRKDLRPVGKG
jgi:N-acetylglutamate synthase-like GNAT family acetyltransferase